MNNVYEKAERQLAVLKSKAAGYRLQGATEERGEELKPVVDALYDRLLSSPEAARELSIEDFAPA